MTRDGEAVETVADLDPDRQVHYSSRTGGLSRSVHLESDCYHLDHAKNQFSGPARQLPPDRGICRECSGAAEYGAPDDADLTAIRRKLTNLDPDDIGLSALGERPRGDR